MVEDRNEKQEEEEESQNQKGMDKGVWLESILMSPIETGRPLFENKGWVNRTWDSSAPASYKIQCTSVIVS